MGPESGHLEDETTWQQPGPAPESGPGSEPAPPSDATYDRATIADSDATAAGDLDGRDGPDPAATEAFRTAGDGLATMAAPDSSASGSSSSGAATATRMPVTQPMDGGSSAAWDALPPPTFEPGHVVFDKYRLIQKIGQGGMGEVWSVWHVHLDTERALKLIKSELAHNEKGWRRFQREARLMAKINHPAAVAVYDFRRVQSVAYIEMEFIRGRSLADVLKQNDDRPMPVEWVARVLEQLCAVLHEAHGHVDEATGEPRPIIHRDLKPSNLMLVERRDDSGPPRIKVLDFGIAKIVEEDAGPDLTAAGDLVGTPAYMSPEQIRGGFDKEEKASEVDGRSDLYSTGVVLYHLLTGKLPFRGGRMALLAAHLNSPPIPMKQVNPECEVPEDVERVVLQCLEKDPADRPQTARELAERFFRAAGLAAEMTSFATLPIAAPIAPAASPDAETVPLLAPSNEPTTVMATMTGAAIPAETLVMPAPMPEPTPAAPGRPAWVVPTVAASAMVAIAALGASMLARDRGRSPLPDPSPAARTAGPTDKAPKDDGPVPVVPALWVPKGYEAVDPSDIVPGHPGYAAALRRSDDGATFAYFADRVYLPTGYKPESPGDLVGEPGWPRTLVRLKDGARFSYVRGDVYRRGDPRDGAPAADAAGNPITPHSVRVPGFYIQQTETTNGELSAYAKEHPEDREALKPWSEWLARFVADHPKASDYPALLVGYDLARKYARSVDGRIPTEAEWEWAARSQDERALFAWGAEMPPTDPPPWACLFDPNAAATEPAPVRSFAKKDQTSVEVFDMVGNVRELCADPYVPYGSLPLKGNSRKSPLDDARRPLDPTDPSAKVVVKGGSFLTASPVEASAFYRYAESPAEPPPDVGFRVVLECPPSEAPP